MKKIFLFWLGLIITRSTIAQSSATTILQIGEKMPNLTYKVTNYRANKIRLSDFKDKWIVLDYWTSWCGACIELIPHMEDLQRKYKDKIQFIMVNAADSKEWTQNFFNIRKQRGEKISLPSIVESRALTKTFFDTSRGFPMEVWISPDGRLVAVTDQLDLTEKNIKKLLNGDKVNFTNVSYSAFSYDPDKPLLIANNGGSDSAYLVRSIIVPFNGQLRSVISAPVSSKRGKIMTVTNDYGLDLVQTFYFRANNITDVWNDPYKKRVILEENVNERLKKYPYKIQSSHELLEYNKSQVFSYELEVPSSTSAKAIYNKAYSDVSTFFNCKANIERRQTACLALRMIDRDSSIFLPAKERKRWPNGRGFFDYQGTTLFGLSLLLNDLLLDVPIVLNEITHSNMDDFIDADLEKLLKDKNLDQVNEVLRKYHLELVPAQRELDMLVIRSADEDDAVDK